MPLQLPSSKQQIENIWRERLPVVVEQAKAAPFHKKRMDGIDPAKCGDYEEFRKIPILDKEELRALSPQQFMTDFNQAPREKIHEYWRSGGSTGKPLFYPRTFEDMPYLYLGFSRGVQICGIGSGDTVHDAFPLGIHPVGHMYARVCQQLGAGVNWAGAGNSTPSALQIQLIDQMKPTVWMGMSSYGIHLANLAKAEGIDLSQSSVKKMITSAEPLSAAKREKIQRQWGAEIFDTFGMTECCLMGAEGNDHDGFHIWTDMFFIEVLNPETLEPVAEGEEGTLVVTPLWTNNATPFVRWNAGDLVTYREELNDAGDYSIFPVVKHAHRTTGFFKVRGVNITHSDFEDFMFASPEVNDFKCELVTGDDDLDLLQVSIEVREGEDAADVVKALGGKIKNVFEVTPKLIVLETGSIAREFESSVKAPRFADKRQ